MADFIQHILLFKLSNDYSFLELPIRFAVSILSLFVIIRFMYTKNSSRKEFIFSYYAIGVTVFILCYLLESVKLELGFALGLFAIFGIIRYRTDTIPIKEMTYLFVVIGISVINALTSSDASFLQLFLTNGAIVVSLWLLERFLTGKIEYSMKIEYEKIDKIHAKSRHQLLEDLRLRTGLAITRFTVCDIDFLRDSMSLIVYYENDLP